MSNVRKFDYTTGDIFTLTGSKYIGYYNIRDNKPYVSKYEQLVELTNVDTINNEIITSDAFFNRIANENVTLQWSLSDFNFQPNEIINSNAINLKIEKAYDNYVDMYRSCFVVSSKLPYSFNKTAILSATSLGYGFTWNINNTSATLSGLSTFNPLITPNSKICTLPNTYSDNTTLVIASSAAVFVYKVNPSSSTFSFVFSSMNISTYEQIFTTNNLQYKNITCIDKYSNILVVGDAGNNAAYQYNAASVTDEDRALGFKFDIINSVQFAGFKPTLVTLSESTIFIYNSASNEVLYFNTSFNQIDSYKDTAFFNVSTPVSLTHYKIYDQLFVLTSDFNLLVLAANSSPILKTTFDKSGFAPGEVARKLIFSNTSSDIFYLLTNKGIYKKHVSNMFSSIGNFSFTQNITGSNTPRSDGLYDISILETTKPTDEIMLFGFQQFVSYNETTTFNTILK